ncbi:MAG TPA: hypothetical protein DD381_07955 [Lentisphaeria bacterium]|nr:MAG: hypothetical protein A2X47_04520 [Lentisphaerae bacterium GWF2_38_69]HBM16255.1 hypothetical protein [Lentisphaeria bacterium]
MLESAIRNKSRTIIVVLSAVILLLGLFTIYKYLLIKDSLKTTLTTEISLINNATISLSREESTVQEMADYFCEKFKQGSYAFTKESLNNFIEDINPFQKSILQANKNINGAWTTLNPDLFMEIKGKKITFQNFSYTCWYHRDEKNNIVKAPRLNERITPETDPYYFKAAEEGKLIITEIYTDQKLGIEMISLATPMYIDDKLLGVTGIDIAAQDISKSVQEMDEVSRDTEIFIFDPHGKFIIGSATPDKELTAYIQKVCLASGNKSEKSTILNNKLILIEDKNNEGPFIAGEIPLNSVQGNLKCILYTLYCSLVLLLVLIIIILALVKKDFSEPEIPDTNTPYKKETKL